MKKMSMSILFFGVLSLSASDQGAPVKLELVRAAVAACNLVGKKEGGWKHIRSMEDLAEFAGKIVEYQIESRKECEEKYRACSVPGFSGSFFGFILPEILGTREPSYDCLVFTKPGQRNGMTRILGRVSFAACTEIRMRLITDEAREAIKVEMKECRGEFDGLSARVYAQNIRSVLGIKTEQPRRKQRTQ